MGLGRKSFNDMIAQCSKKLIQISYEEREKRISEINNCDHLFVKLREYDKENNIDNDSTIVECVHCGVTNKFYDLERVLSKYKKSLDYYVLTNYHYTNVKFEEVTIESLMMDKLKQEKKEIKLLSNRVIRTLHPGVLYHIAKLINPDATDEELFEIMLELNELETFEEKEKLNSMYDATDLINRYNSQKVYKKI